MPLPKEKQIALLKLAGITVAVMFCFWFFLIRPAQTRFNQKTKAAADLSQKLAAKKRTIEQSEQTKAEIKEKTRELREIENSMVMGDVYLWIEKTLRDFEIPGQIEFTKYDPPQIVESDLPLKLPYKVASFAVSGSAAYHDLGTFLANFENSYPHIRVRRLEMEPAVASPIGTNAIPTSTSEKLTFLLEVQVLIKPTGTQPRS